MKYRRPWFVALRGATAYELQIKRLVVRVTHLRGRYWKWRPWRRVSFQWLSTPEEER